MSKNNFKVATTENGKTPKQDTKHPFATANVKKDKTPTGKTKTLKDKEQLKKEREEQYINFRVNALKRRAKRMGLSDEETEKKVGELMMQINMDNTYNILILFNTKDLNLVKEALKNEGLVCKMMSTSHLYIEGDKEVLDTLRKIMPPSAKIHPYVQKKPPILPIKEVNKEEKKPKNRASIRKAAKAAKKQRKADNIAKAANRKKSQGKKWAKAQKRIKLLAAKKKAKATTVQLKPKKRSTTTKKASTLKQAA